jgi:hypothetical protein
VLRDPDPVAERSQPVPVKGGSSGLPGAMADQLADNQYQPLTAISEETLTGLCSRFKGTTEEDLARAKSEISEAVDVYLIWPLAFRRATNQERRKALAAAEHAAAELMRLCSGLCERRLLGLDDFEVLGFDALEDALERFMGGVSVMRRRLAERLPRRAPNYRVGYTARRLAEVFRKFDRGADGAERRRRDFVLDVFALLPDAPSEDVLKQDYLSRLVPGPLWSVRWEPRPHARDKGQRLTARPARRP